jgi:hypothetical protein
MLPRVAVALRKAPQLRQRATPESRPEQAIGFEMGAIESAPGRVVDPLQREQGERRRRVVRQRSTIDTKSAQCQSCARAAFAGHRVADPQRFSNLRVTAANGPPFPSAAARSGNDRRQSLARLAHVVARKNQKRGGWSFCLSFIGVRLMLLQRNTVKPV